MYRDVKYYRYCVTVRCYYGEEYEEDYEYATVELDITPDEIDYFADADWLFDEVIEHNNFKGRPIEITDIEEEF